MEKINISVSKKTLNAADASSFTNITVNVSDLQTKLKSHNYSLIKWKNGKRKADNFESASGIVVDIDKDLSITDAIKKLNQEDLNYVIVTSKSHQTDKNGTGVQDRFHILLFFTTEVGDPVLYKRAFRYAKQLFPQLDESCKDLARFIFYSPDKADYYGRFSCKNIDVSTLPDNQFIEMGISEVKQIWEFSNDINVKLGNGNIIKLTDIKGKQPCHCLRDDHNDQNASAFIVFNEDHDKWMTHCSGCEFTGWSEFTKQEYLMNQNMKNFYYLGSDIFEMGMADEVFFMTRNSKENFSVTIGAIDSDEAQDALINLISQKRMRTLTRIDHIGNPDIDRSEYSVDKTNGLITVNVAAITERIKDNKFIEDYLQTTFGSYKDFIKQYLAMYTYTNYVKLPTLVLYGPRGTSKTTFAGLVADIYPSLYIDWSGEESNFTQECEKKLLIIEENLIDEKSQYKTLKKYTGQDMLKVNKKYQPEYMVKNNVNIILISNEMIPLYVEKTEKPTDDTNNQFFVWEFSPLATSNDGTFRNKLRERLGNYIRTELKTVFAGINKTYPRYGIPVPITSYEDQLFENNVTNIEAQADQILEKIENRELTYLPLDDEFELYRNRYLPYTLVEEYAKGGINPNAIIKNLKKRKIIQNKNERKKIKNKRFSCFKIN